MLNTRDKAMIHVKINVEITHVQ